MQGKVRVSLSLKGQKVWNVKNHKQSLVLWVKGLSIEDCCFNVFKVYFAKTVDNTKPSR